MGNEPNRNTDMLAKAVRDAGAAHADSLRRGDEMEIATLYRAVLVAEVALLRDCGGRADRAAADQLVYEIEHTDGVIANLIQERNK